MAKEVKRNSRAPRAPLNYLSNEIKPMRSQPVRRPKQIFIVASREYPDIGNIIDQVVRGIDFQTDVVSSCSNINEIMEALKQNKYDGIIITNNPMALEDILLVIPRIKAHYPKLKIIVMSGGNRNIFVEVLKKYRSIVLLPLPFVIEQLENVVLQLFGDSSLERYVYYQKDIIRLQR